MKELKDKILRFWKDRCASMFRWLIIVTWTAFCVFAFSSCASKKIIEYKDRDVNHYITQVLHDTLIDKKTDSIYYEVLVRGDTVYKTKYREKTQWRDRIVEKHDTCWRDSVVVQNKNTIKEVVKIPIIYKFSLFLSIIFCIFVIIKFVRWLQIH